MKIHKKFFAYWFIRYFLTIPFYLLFFLIFVKNGKYRKLLNNEEIFIFGSGHSINDHDLSGLVNKNIIFINNFCSHNLFKNLMKNNNCFYIISPFHFPQTKDEILDFLKIIEKNVNTNVPIFFGLTPRIGNAYSIIKKNSLFKNHDINFYLVGNFFKNSFKLNWIVSMAGAGSIYAIYLGLYMGCGKFYLLGMDHDYFLKKNQNFNFYKQLNIQKNEIKLKSKNYVLNELNRQHRIFKDYIKIRDRNPVIIYNCSKRGILDVFPRIDLNKIINNKK